jgi:hypothetical protein
MLGLVLIALLCGCGSREAKSLLDEWKGTNYRGQIVYINFQDAESFYIEVFHPENQSDGFNALANYSVDFSKTPAHFNYQVDDRPAMKSIIEFVDEDTIAFEDASKPGERPTRFGSRRVVLKRD